jgi:hypothetical protein
MSAPREVKSKNYLRSTGFLQKEGLKKREVVRPNQIVITDFSFCEAIFEKKRKRCPLYLLNKKTNKKTIEQSNIFTKEGIITPITNQDSFGSIDKSERKHRTLEKCGSATPKKHLVPFNFVRAKTPKHITISHHLIEDIPIFEFCSKKRYLDSACTERKPAIPKERHRRTLTHSKPQFKSQIKDP